MDGKCNIVVFVIGTHHLSSELFTLHILVYYNPSLIEHELHSSSQQLGSMRDLLIVFNSFRNVNQIRLSAFNIACIIQLCKLKYVEADCTKVNLAPELMFNSIDGKPSVTVTYIGDKVSRWLDVWI